MFSLLRLFVCDVSCSFVMSTVYVLSRICLNHYVNKRSNKVKEAKCLNDVCKFLQTKPLATKLRNYFGILCISQHVFLLLNR